MSGDAATVRYGLQSATCRCCGDGLDHDDHRVCQLYADEGVDPLAQRALGFCGACRDEVAELVDTWTAVPEPPLDGPSIAAGYARVADACSFCEDLLGDAPALGIEYYRAGSAVDGGLADLRHFALCAHCASVFAEFLDGVAEA